MLYPIFLLFKCYRPGLCKVIFIFIVISISTVNIVYPSIRVTVQSPISPAQLTVINSRGTFNKALVQFL
jgi:hypothetical protein